MKTRAIYAFSGDPVTFGHIDIIQRASRIFDHLTVAIGVNPDKKYTFSLEQRRKMAEMSLAPIKNVSVIAFEGLLVDYAFEHNIPVIIKGVRNSSDFDYEIWLHQVTDSQKLAIDTFLLPARQSLAHVSSSSAKALQLEQGLIHEYVPLYVKQCLEAAISGQYILGISGEIGSGKSWVSEKLREIGAKQGIDVFNIELDFIGHQILSALKEPVYKEIRQEIIRQFGPSVKNAEGGVNRKKLGDIVFNDKEKLDRLNDIFYTPLVVRLRRELYHKQGLILFNAALIAESDMTYLCNNNVLLLHVDKESQKKRLEKRKLSEAQITKRLESQFNEAQKREQMAAAVSKSSQGKLWTYDNSDGADENKLEKLYQEIISYMDVFGFLRFKSLWYRSRAKGDFEVIYNHLKICYAARNRYYHNLLHIIDGLNHLTSVRDKIKNIEILEFAWWYHDVVYEPLSHENEYLSAQSALKDLTSFGFDADFTEKVISLIDASKNHEDPEDEDMAYFFDIDLAVLGSPWEDFLRYEENIRREYAFIDDNEYNKCRCDFLVNLLKRKTIYHTEHFQSLFEKKAHENIRDLLKQKGIKNG
ncbi:MAG: pantetheine-phosphate adenylyltransferase [Spirochaetales bacterium]|nr:pantetheine-phosphate adenylyltransferase [Spirochaetales bacterium]